jgi:glycosyltransferase involved in cell wall biosynthesis
MQNVQPMSTTPGRTAPSPSPCTFRCDKGHNVTEPLPSDSPRAQPFFSIAVPAYNAETTLAAAIESIQNQDFGDWELILVDDGSTDDTRRAAESFALSDPRITVVSQANAGCGAARNTAIEHARGIWIVRFDADDLLLPDFLARIHDVIAEHPDVEIISPSGWQRYRDADDKMWRPDPRYDDAFELSLDDALHGWCPVFTHSAFRRSLWERIGGIRSNAYAEDYDFWVRSLADGAKGWFFPEALSAYDCGNSSQMSARGNRLTASFLETLEFTASQHSLSPADQAAIEVRIGQLKRRLAFRNATQRVLGEEGSDRLANRIVSVVNWYRAQRERLARRS